MLEDRRLMTTSGWISGTPPTTMTFNSVLQRQLDQVTSRVVLSPVSVKDNVTQANSFVATTTGAYRISTSQYNNALDTVLGVYNTAGQRLAFNDDISSTNHFSSLTVNLKAGQEYRVAVGRYTTAPNTTTRYAKLTIDGPDDDAYESAANDNPAAGTALGTLDGKTQIANLMMRDLKDCFAFHLSGVGGDQDYLQIDFQHAQGDLDMALYDSQGALLRYSDSSTNQERISLEDLQTGDYTFMVYGYHGATNPNYNLTADFEGVTPAPDPGPNPGPSLGDQLVTWSRARLGQKVGDGQCASFIDAALRANGAKSFDELGPTGADADYVWGTLVVHYRAGDAAANLSNVQAGDIIQYRNIRITNPDGSWSSASHHTAMVAANLGNGQFSILEQNWMNNDPAGQVVHEVNQTLANMTAGEVWIYRPISR